MVNRFALPAELLCIVFSHLPLKERIAVTHVCHAWREIALESPSALWAQIAWDGHYSEVGVLEYRLARSGSALLDLRITVDNITHKEVYALLFTNLHRIRTLSLDAGLVDNSCGCTETFLTNGSAPELEYLEVRTHVNLEEPLFEGHTPKLERLHLSGVRILYRNSFQFSVCLVTLELPRMTIPFDIQDIIFVFPELEVLQLTAIEYCLDIFWRDDDGQLIELPSCFDSLIIRAKTIDSMLDSSVLAPIPLNEIDNIEFSVEGGLDGRLHVRGEDFPHNSELYRTLIDTLPGKAMHMSFRYVNGQSEIILSNNTDKRAHRIFYVNTATVAPWLMTTLFILSLREQDLFIWHETKQAWLAQFELPNLCCLSVFLLDADAQRDEKQNWQILPLMPGPFVGRPPPFITAPELSILRIATTEPAAPAVSAGTICDFVQRHLGRTRQRPLQHIWFDGVPLLEGRPEEVARLTGLCRNLGMSPQVGEWAKNASWVVMPPEVDFF